MPEKSPIEQHPMNPHLRYIDRVRWAITEPQKNPDGTETHWQDLHKNVKPYDDALALNENVHEAVFDFVAEKVPGFKEKIPAFRRVGKNPISNQRLAEALVHNWVKQDVAPEGQRREVLMAVAAHVVERIESHTYKEVLQRADEHQLHSLGLTPGLRDIAVATMDVAEKADPLFIRFLAYSRLTPDREEDEEGLETSLFLPDDENAYTTTTLFPKETKALARGLKKIADERQNWQGITDKEGADAFATYLQSLSRLYAETDPEKAKEAQAEVFEEYKKLYDTDFSIIVLPATTPTIKTPHIDPELRVCLAYKNETEEQKYERAKNAMAQNLGVIGQEKFAPEFASVKTKRVVTIGNYGVNVIFNAAAQEVPDPYAIIFVDEQRMQLDKDFPDLMARMIETGNHFSQPFTTEGKDFLEFMSMMNTVLHEYSHAVFPEIDKSIWQKKFGGENAKNIGELKAEIVYRALMPEIIAAGGLDGTREQWNLATLLSEMQILQDDDNSDDAYFMAARFVLNPLLSRGAVQFNEKTRKYEITNHDLYEEIAKTKAKELLLIYEDPDVTPEVVSAWLQKECKANELVKEMRERLQVKIEVFDPTTNPWEKIKDDIMDLEEDIFGDDAFDEETMRDAFEDPDNTIVIMRDENERPIGYTWATPAKKTYEDESDYDVFQGREASDDTAYIYNTGLRPDFRGKKFVVDLYKAQDNKLLRKGYKRVHVDAAVENGFGAKILKNNQGKVINHFEHDSPYGRQMFIDMWIEPPVQTDSDEQK